MHQNVATMTEDVEALHENVLFLKELFEKIDQVEVCINLCHIQYCNHGTPTGICVFGEP